MVLKAHQYRMVSAACEAFDVMDVEFVEPNEQGSEVRYLHA